MIKRLLSNFRLRKWKRMFAKRYGEEIWKPNEWPLAYGGDYQLGIQSRAVFGFKSEADFEALKNRIESRRS